MSSEEKRTQDQQQQSRKKAGEEKEGGDGGGRGGQRAESLKGNSAFSTCQPDEIHKGEGGEKGKREGRK